MNNMNAENNEQPLVSIAIALYNKEDSIYRTLQSIQNQTYKNFECIIVDDHSTDNGPNIVYQCFCKNDKRFKLTMNTTEEQYVDAHNQSYEMCSGKYLFRVDADDIFFPDYLEFNIKYLDEHPEYDAISSYSYFKQKQENGLFENDDNISLQQAFSDNEINWFNKCPAHSMLGNTIIWSNPTSVIRKKFFDEYKPKYTFYAFGDYFFWYNVLANGGRLHFVKEIHSCRFNYNSKSNNKVSNDDSFYFLTPRMNFVLNTYKYKALEHIEYTDGINKDDMQKIIQKYKDEANDAFELMTKVENSYND